jgi:hypothetical protein
VKKQTKLLFKTEKKHGKIQQRKTKQAQMRTEEKGLEAKRKVRNSPRSSTRGEERDFFLPPPIFGDGPAEEKQPLRVTASPGPEEMSCLVSPRGLERKW